MQTLKLRKPLLINGKEVNELTYDTEKITGEMFNEADFLSSSAAAKRGLVTMDLAEFDTGFQYYLGLFAIIAVNPEYDINDLMRIGGSDLMSIYRIGRVFTGGVEEETTEESESSQEESSEEYTEDIPEHTTPASQN